MTLSTRMKQSASAPVGLSAFTLVELLVVITIIALLVSILLPALSKATIAANTVVCEANLRQIDTAMIMYAQQWNGAILGNAWTSSYFLFPNGNVSSNSPWNSKNCPTVISAFDWMSPVALILGLNFDEGPSLTNRTNRINTLTAEQLFHCPENNIVVQYAPYGSSGPTGLELPAVGSTLMMSYNTVAMFQVAYQLGAAENNPLYKGYVNMGNYKPNIGQVGDTTWKIFICDGAMYSNGTYPTADFNWNNQDTGQEFQYFTDEGPWDAFTHGFYNTTLTGTGGVPRMLAFRHGARGAGVPYTTPGSTTTALKTYRMNAAFFDGHVETISGLDSMDPSHWLPVGSDLSTIVRPEPSAESMYESSYYPVPGLDTGVVITR